jgi:hypothetical protein
MSYQDPPRRQRLSRYSALTQYEDGYSSYQDNQAGYDSGTGYQDGRQGFAGLAGTPEQHAPWDDPQPTGLWDTSSLGSVRDSGAQGSIWDTAAQRALRNSGAQPAAWDSQAQITSWDTPAQQGGWEVPRRGSGAFPAAADDIPDPAEYASGRQARRGGLLPGALVGFLAAAVALGVANLVAAFVRPQASPIIAVGEAFIDRTPPALKNFAVQKFGENDKNMLLLGMYVTIALIAIAIGILAWRRVSIGVAGIGLFGLFGAFVAITRPESHATDVIPSVIGGIAGIAVLVWLVRVAMPKRRYRAGWSS